MRVKILITGVPGFAASQLAYSILVANENSESLMIRPKNEDIEIHGTKRVRTDMYRLEKLGIADQIKYHLIELTDSVSVYNVIKEVMPDQIYHLAAQDYVKSSWDSPHETFRTNVEGTINLFMAIRQCYPRRISSDPILINNLRATDQYQVLEYPKVLVTSTSESYGYHKERIHENTEQKPINPYGISKLCQDSLSRLYACAYNIPVVITRSFNVTGWGRNDPFVDSDFARQVATIEKNGKGGIISHGNLEAKRTFFDVKDAVRGYYLAMNSEYNKGDVFCFGAEESTSIQQLLNYLTLMSTSKITTKVDKSRFRPIDTDDMRGDFSKAERLLGWKAQVPLEQSLKELLNYWRERV